MDDRQAREEESGGSVKSAVVLILVMKSHCVPNQNHHVAQLQGALSNWQPCGWNGQTVLLSDI